MEKIGIFIEIREGELKKHNLGVITAMRAPGRTLTALVPEGGAETHLPLLERYGVTEVVELAVAGGSVEAHPEVRAEALAEAVTALDLSILAGLTSAIGKDVLPRIAAMLDVPLVMDALGVDLDRRTVAKSQFSGKVTATVAVEGPRWVVGLRPNAVTPVEAPVRGSHRKLVVSPAAPRIRLRTILRSEAADVDLSEAEIIISGGRSMAAKENFAIIEACAAAMGAAVGASRAAVDAGYTVHTRQVGQTGTTVGPKLYIACGISGAVQHLAGMKTSRVVVAINTDPEAPIVKESDYFLQGDLFEIVPQLTRRIQSTRSD